MEKIEIDRSKFRGSQNQYITQALFLELGYDTDSAVFTFDEEHKVYKGTTYYSLKKLYIEMEDPTEILFSREYLMGWKHWKRMLGNKAIFTHIEDWREELNLILIAKGVQGLLDIAASDNGNYQASKYLADNGWSDKKRGRPSKEEVEAHLEKQSKLKEDDDPDVILLKDFKKG